MTRAANIIVTVTENWKVTVDLMGNHTPYELCQSKEGKEYWKCHKKYFMDFEQTLKYICNCFVLSGRDTFTIDQYLERLSEASKELDKAVMSAVARVSEDE